MSVRTRLASALRDIAQKLDGRRMMSLTLHQENVRNMNSYIESTEKYIGMLERFVRDPDTLDLFRKKYGRFDTSKLYQWKDEA